MTDERSLAQLPSQRRQAFLDEIGQVTLMAAIAVVIVVSTGVYYLLMRYRGRTGQERPPEELPEEKTSH